MRQDDFQEIAKNMSLLGISHYKSQNGPLRSTMNTGTQSGAASPREISRQLLIS